MKNNNFRMLYDNDIVSSIKELISNVSILKSSIFKSVLGISPISSYEGNKFMSFVDSYLTNWEKFAMDMKQKISSSIDPKNVRSIDYNFIKDYIYNKYDYNAMVDFTDALYIGIGDGKFKKKEDIDDFFHFTISKAFCDDNIPDSIAGLLDSILVSNNLYEYTIDENNRIMFNSIKHHKNLFNPRDKIMLLNNTKKIINFITDKSMVNKLLPSNDINLYVASINMIMEFITYSLSMYAIRIYGINLFVYPFINSVNNNITESTNSKNLPYTGNNENMQITIMRDMDESYINYVNIKKLIDEFSNASTSIGADSMYQFEKPKYEYRICIHNIHLKDNIFVKKLFFNDLYSVIINKLAYYTDINYKYTDEYLCGTLNNFEELNLLLKSLIYNSQGISTNTTSKQEFFAIIRSIDCDNTITAYRKLFADLFLFLAVILGSIDNAIRILNSFINKIPNITNYQLNSNNIKNIASENLNILKELYSELCYLFIQKGREIESRYNLLTCKSLTDTIDLNLGKAMTTQTRHELPNDIMNAVPDTFRTPIDLSNLYALPTFEHFQFYDEFVKQVYFLEDDIYYSESFNINEIINVVMSIINSIGKNIQNWWNNGKRQAALNWANKYGNNVTKMDFSNKTMEVLPFKNNGNSELIDLNPIIGKLIVGFKNFKEDVINSPDDVVKYIKSLYPDPVIYDWFHTSDKIEEAKAKFHSYVLFRDLNNVITEPEKLIKISNNEINKRCGWWLQTCKEGQKIYNELVKVNNSISKSQSDIQRNITNIVKDSNNKSSQETLASAAAQKDDNKESNQNDKSDSNVDKNLSEKASNVNMLLREIQNVVNNIYKPLMMISMEYIDTEYRYLKQAYAIGSTQNNS